MKRITAVAICFCVLFASSLSQSESEFEPKTNITPQTKGTSSPKRTWVHFKKALISGDYERAYKYCCPESNKFINKFERLGREKVIDIFQSMKPIEKIYQHEDKAKYKVPRNINGKELISYLYFAKIDNEWKINKY